MKASNIPLTVVVPIRAMTIIAALLVAGCTAENDNHMQIHTQLGNTTLGITVPGFLAHRAVNQAALSPSVTLNGESIDLLQSGQSWSGNTSVAEGSNATIEVRWSEQIGTRSLNLARLTRQLAVINSNQSVRITADEYDTDSFDDDSDRISNLTERLENTNPFDALDPGVDRPQVFLPAIDPANAPVIDGLYDAVWGNAGFLDRNRANLQIDNLMIDQGAIRLDGETEYQWAGMHDGEYLYLFVFGEFVDRRTPFADSEMDWHDDALDIFLDGDNSKLNSYDGVNDFHFIMPLLKRGDVPIENRSGDVDSRLTLGINSAALSAGLDFATCYCDTDRNTWEVRINLDAVQIQVGQAFGLELQLNDDNDGGDRDAKWGWFHPSRINVDVDNTWRIPGFMGTALLEAPSS